MIRKSDPIKCSGLTNEKQKKQFKVQVLVELDDGDVPIVTSNKSKAPVLQDLQICKAGRSNTEPRRRSIGKGRAEVLRVAVKFGGEEGK